MKPTALIAEDERALRDELTEQLGALWPELDIVASVADGIQALLMLEEHRPDVLFLDIHMPGVNGIDVARQASGRAHVVFVTAHDEHAVAAFEHGAVDYVLKPIAPARLFTTVARLKERVMRPPQRIDGVLAQFAPAAAPATRPFLRWINASVGQIGRAHV